MMGVKISWTSETSDGFFGTLSVVDGTGNVQHSFVCVTNLKLRILDGDYVAVVDMSPRLKYNCPHIKVPLRDTEAGGDAGLRIHKANEPSQSLGCVFPGEQVDGDAVDDSKDAFNAMMALLPQDGSEFPVSIQTALS
jgi:Family of unknown function (DUF5675)